MEKEVTQNNIVTLSGKIVTEPVYSHEVLGEKFYEAGLEVKRLSDMADILPVSLSERLMLDRTFNVGDEITVTGQFRSYNKVVGDKSKLMLTVFVRDVFEIDPTVNPNSIDLLGYICKPPVFRTTPFNREICDVLIAVNRQYNKSDYIPCIAWGRNARYVRNMAVGVRINISGRIQSRVYQKKLDDETVVNRTAYEVSISRVTLDDGMYDDEYSDAADKDRTNY